MNKNQTVGCSFARFICVLDFDCLLSSQISSEEIYLYNLSLFCSIQPRVRNV